MEKGSPLSFFADVRGHPSRIKQHTSLSMVKVLSINNYCFSQSENISASSNSSVYLTNSLS